MNGSNMYIGIIIMLLLIILIVMVLLNRREGKRPGALSTLASLAFGFIVAGMVFNENRNVGYSLIGIGVIISIIDIIRKLRNRS